MANGTNTGNAYAATIYPESISEKIKSIIAIE